MRVEDKIVSAFRKYRGSIQAAERNVHEREELVSKLENQIQQVRADLEESYERLSQVRQEAADEVVRVLHAAGREDRGVVFEGVLYTVRDGKLMQSRLARPLLVVKGDELLELGGEKEEDSRC